jgi:ribosome-associated protein
MVYCMRRLSMEKLSRTRKKALALSAQDLGEKLVKLTQEQLAKIPLPEEILSAVHAAQKITKHGALKRQMQYIGVMMRKADVEPIQEAVGHLEEGNRKRTELHKQVEHWRDALIGGNDAVIKEILTVLPGVQEEQLIDFVTKAREELMKLNPSPRPSRALFRYLYKSTD